MPPNHYQPSSALVMVCFAKQFGFVTCIHVVVTSPVEICPFPEYGILELQRARQHRAPNLSTILHPAEMALSLRCTLWFVRQESHRNSSRGLDDQAMTPDPDDTASSVKPGVPGSLDALKVKLAGHSRTIAPGPKRDRERERSILEDPRVALLTLSTGLSPRKIHLARLAVLIFS